MKKALFLLPLLLLGGCSNASEREYPEIEAKAQQYLQAQASGDWQNLCRSLAPSEQRNIQRALGAPCQRALSKNRGLARRLQKTSTQITEIEQEEDSYHVLFESGEIWITPEGITFTRP